MLTLDDLRKNLQTGDAMRRRLITALLSLVFLALGAVLLLSARGILRDEGVTARRVVFEGGGGKLWLPELVRTRDVPLYEEDHSGHPESLPVGGSLSAALVLGSGRDGTRALSAELARRGVAVLLPDRNTRASAAWDWLAGQSYIRISSMALIASIDRSDEALALGEDLSSSDRAPTATILIGDDGVLHKAASYPGRNLLVLTAREAEAGAKAVFFGAGYDARTDFSGYFGDGTARAAAAVRGRAAFSSRKTLRQILDWQGSALGHVVELPDDNAIFPITDFCRIASAFCLAAAAAVWPLRRGEKKGESGSIQKRRPHP